MRWLPRCVQPDVFCTTTAAFTFLAAASSPTRGVSAIRNTVDRDFLHAHFQAHLLQRDWLPQSSPFSSFSSSHSSFSSSSSSSSSPADYAATARTLQDAPSSNKVLFVTAIYGDYEKTLKEPAQQHHPADFVAFTDRTDLASPTWQIRLVEDPLDYLLKHGGRVGVGASVSGVLTDASVDSAKAGSRADGTAAPLPAIDGINSLARNRHPFNLAKVFKMQFYRFFDLKEYRAAAWITGVECVVEHTSIFPKK